MSAAELCVPKSAGEYFALTEEQKIEVKKELYREMFTRKASESDLKNIVELKKAGWKATEIASGLEMDVRTVRKAIKQLEIKPEASQERLDREMVGRVQ